MSSPFPKSANNFTTFLEATSGLKSVRSGVVAGEFDPEADAKLALDILRKGALSRRQLASYLNLAAEQFDAVVAYLSRHGLITSVRHGTEEQISLSPSADEALKVFTMR